ncbi:MAG: stage III sporulation protein AB, partial [Oscillospiraceae bacterium]|nr:stage III sporulation protein AB [Oscillospiraceae bacterium]
MLIKLLGLIAIVICGAGAGLSGAMRLKRRTEELALSVKLISDIGTLIRYSGQETASLFSTLADNPQYEGFVFLNTCRKLVEAGKSPREAFRMAMVEGKDGLCLKKEEIGLLQSFFSGLGRSDASGQESVCELHA